MIREHLVNGLITNNGECICNPEVLLGTNYGVFNLENEIAPRGMLLDLNAAWELFFSKKDLYNLRFRKEVSPLGTKTVTLNNETAELIEVAEDETLWILWDTDSGKDTNAWLKTDKSYGVSLNDLEFENETLYLYYDLTRVLTDNEYSENPEVPYHYYRNDGTPTGDRNDPDIVKDDLGQPFIFLFTGVPKDKIFDEHELHTLFPWYADPSHIVRLKLNIDNSTNTHPSLRSGNTPTVLGDMTITPLSEVFVGENPNREHIYEKGNELVSLLSIFEQLKVVLGVVLNKGNEITSLSDKGPWYDDHNTAGESKHYRYESNNFKSSLDGFPESVNNIVDALNELNNGLNLKAWESIIKLLEMINGKPVDTTNGKEPTPSNIIWNLTRLNERLSQISGGTDNYIDVVDVLNYLSDLLGDLEEDLEELDEDLRKKIGYNFLTGQWLELLPNRLVSEWDPGLTKQQARVIKAINYIDGLIKNTSDEIGERCDEYTQKENGEYVYTLWSAICKLTDRVGDIETKYLYIDNWGGITNYNEGDTFVDIINNLYGSVEEDYENVREKIGWKNNNWKTLNNHFNPTSPDTRITMPVIDALNLLGDEIDELGSESPFEYVNKNDKENCGVRLKNRQNDPVGDGTFIVGSDNKSDNELGGLNAKGKDNFIIGNDNDLNDTNNSYAFGMSNTISGDTSVTIGLNNYIHDGSESYAFGSSNTINNTDSITIGDSNTVNSYDTTVIGIGNTINSPNSIILSNDRTSISNSNISNIISIGNLNNYYSNSTHIGKDIYIQTKNGTVEDKLQDLIFVDLGKWAISYSSGDLTNSSTPIFKGLVSVVNSIKSYISNINGLLGNNKRYCLKFRYVYNSSNDDGIALIENNSARLILRNTTYFSNNINANVPLWHRREGIKLCIAYNGSTPYLAFADLNSVQQNTNYTTDLLDSNNNVANINLQNAFGAVPISEIRNILDIPDKSKIVYKESYIDNSGVTYPGGTIQIKDINYTTAEISDKPNLCNPQTVNIPSTVISYGKNENANGWSIDLAPYMKKLLAMAEKGVPGGYVPLNCNGLIDLQYIPGQTYEVILCWAEYTLEDQTDEQSDIKIETIHLFTLLEVSSSDVTNTGTSSDPVYIYHHNQQDSLPAIKQNDKYYIKGEEITSTGNYPSDPADITKANPSALYIEANKTTNPIHLFKWTGGFWTPYKGLYLTIGTTTGTAFDGGEGHTHVTCLDNPHETTLTKITPEIFIDPHYPTWHTDPDYPGQFPNAHNDLTDESTGTAWKHVQELYTRLNQTEDLIILLDLDIDAIPEDGPILKEHIAYSVNTFFNLYG